MREGKVCHHTFCLDLATTFKNSWTAMWTWGEGQNKRLLTTEFYHVKCPCKKSSFEKKCFTNETFVENMAFTNYSKKYTHLLAKIDETWIFQSNAKGIIFLFADWLKSRAHWRPYKISTMGHFCENS